jgi:hypothetical protein
MLKPTTSPRALICLLISGLMAALPVAGELAMKSDFENGNGLLKEVDSQNGRIVFSPNRIRESRNIWWHVHLTGLEKGKQMEIVVADQDAIGGASHPVYSYDRKTWHRFAQVSSPFRQVFKNESVWIARNIPYTYSDSLALVDKMKGREHVTASDLCTSEAGRPVKMLRITDANTPDGAKKSVWIQARQHAFESHSSHVAEAFAWWMVGEEAAELRRQCIVYIIPIMDVDSVFEGAAGKDQKPVDFNRTWTDTPHWNAVRSTISYLNEVTKKREQGLLAFIDIHSPYFADVNHWYDPGQEPMKSNARKFASLFGEMATDMKAANHWAADAIIPVSTKPTLARNYAIENWTGGEPRALTLIMEVSHWKDGRRSGKGEFITRDGLQDYGKVLGRALATWAASDQ